MLKKNKDYNRRLLYLKFELKLFLLKYLLYNNLISKSEKNYINRLFFFYSKIRLSKTFLVNKSIYSFETRSVSRIFKVSR